MPDTTTDGGNGWQLTLEAATEMATELREDGWEPVTVRAGGVAPEAPADGESDRFGLVYLAQGEIADDLRAAVEDGDFERYEVFSNRTGTDLFLLTRITDPDRKLAVLLVGAVDLSHTDALAAAAHEHGELYSHVELLDGTHVASFHHDDPSAFFPEP